MKPNVSDVDSRSYGHSERLNSTIEVLVIDCIFVVPDSGIWSCHFVAHKPDTITARSRLDLVYNCFSPCNDGWLHSHCRTIFIETEAGSTAYSVFTVGSVVILIAFSRMRLAPGIFMRGHILCFGKIRRARIERGVKVTDLNQNPVRHAVVVVAGVFVRCVTRREISRERINPGARPQVRAGIQTRSIRI